MRIPSAYRQMARMPFSASLYLFPPVFKGFPNPLGYPVVAMSIGVESNGIDQGHIRLVAFHHAFVRRDPDDLADHAAAIFVGLVFNKFALQAQGKFIDNRRIHVQKSNYREIVANPIENGHSIPTLREFFRQGQKDTHTQLILEVKKHATPQRETEVVETIVSLVREMGVEGHTEYLSFSQHVCRELMRLQPGAKVTYVNGDLTPDELKEQGYAGLSYNLNILMNRPEWIVRAHELGLEVTLWMTNQPDIVEWGIRHQVDFVSSDDPVMAKETIRKHQ